MPLPHAERALISREKIEAYLLAREHPEGGGKARFFLSRGYDADRPGELIETLRTIARSGHLVKTIPSRHGMKYIVDGALRTPDGRPARIRTVWIVQHDSRRPRFVTAHPG